MDGIVGDVDMNRFNGDHARLMSLTGDPICRDEPNHQACRGADIESCTPEKKLELIACPSGTACAKKVLGAGYACMDPRCSATVGELGRLCVDATTRAECAGGVYMEAACGGGEVCEAGSCVAGPPGPGPGPDPEPGPEPQPEPGPTPEPIPEPHAEPGSDAAGSETSGGLPPTRPLAPSRTIGSSERLVPGSGCAQGLAPSNGLALVLGLGGLILLGARRRRVSGSGPAMGGPGPGGT